MLKCLHKVYNNWGLKINVKKTYLNNGLKSLEIEINADMKCERFEYFRKGGDKKGRINAIIGEGQQIISYLNRIRWDPHIFDKTERHIGRDLVETVASYECEMWDYERDGKIN
jgi:hypothetical protein